MVLLLLACVGAAGERARHCSGRVPDATHWCTNVCVPAPVRVLPAILIIMSCHQGSRPHYCINAAVIRKGNIDGGCEELMKEKSGCRYKKAASTIGHRLVQVRVV